MSAEPQSAERSFAVAGAWGNRQFRYADPNNKLRMPIQEILEGRAYPIPARPAGYKFDVVIDVGANVGASALWFAAQKPRRLICFEPAAENLVYLKQNLVGLPGIEIESCGLFSRDGEVALYKGKHQNMQHSVIKSVETTDIAETIKLRRASAKLKELKVESISVLKIDTEGCEIPILTDISGTLPRIDFIYVEYHSERDRRDIDALLAPHFVLATSEAKHPHRGVNSYMANRMVDAVPIYGAIALPRPV